MPSTGSRRKPVDLPGMLLLLDEAANIAPVHDLQGTEWRLAQLTRWDEHEPWLRTADME